MSNKILNHRDNKLVYVGMGADLLHPGHLNIIATAVKYGEVIIGLLTDSAVVKFSRLPYMTYEQRKIIMQSVKGVSEVVMQDTLDYTQNLEKIKPDFVVHGDDWKVGVQAEIRKKVIQTLKQWDGKLIEVPYTQGISSTIINDVMREIGVTPEIRSARLHRLLSAKDIVRIMEAHNGLSSLIVEQTAINNNGYEEEFDGIWISSLTQSTAKAKPDNGFLDASTRIAALGEILDVTTKPIIYDGDSGGPAEHFVFTVRELERLGVSAIIIEDKIGLKKNSLFGTEVAQEQDSIENFCDKIASGKANQITKNFMIIARIESLILEKGMQDAITRAKAYLEAGADGIMIHSRSKKFDEVKEFANLYNKLANRKPLVVVPSSYSYVSEKELIENGVNIVIYANQMLRAAYPAMVNVARSILTHHRAKEADEQYCMSIKDIINLIPGGKVVERK